MMMKSMTLTAGALLAVTIAGPAWTASVRKPVTRLALMRSRKPRWLHQAM